MTTEAGTEAADGGLDAFFAAARGPEGGPDRLPAALYARILADAAMPAAGGAAPVIALAPGRGPWRGLLAVLGGWPSVAGLATAALTGVWLGFAGPDGLDGLTPFGPDYTLADFLPAASFADGN